MPWWTSGRSANRSGTPARQIIRLTLNEAAHDRLFEALETGDAEQVRHEIRSLGQDKPLAIISPSRLEKHKFRSPLMAAAATGRLSVWVAVLGAFDDVFIPSGYNPCTGRGREAEMRRQTELKDIHRMTLLMHAGYGGRSAVFEAVAKEVQPAQLRKMLPAKDENGMTFLHHAVNAQSDKNFDYETGQCRSPEAVDDNDHGHAPFAPSIAANGVVPTVIERCCCGCYMHAEDVDIAVELNPWLPIIWDALHFSRRSLSLPEYRCMLWARDAWSRTILEHSIMTGRRQIFHAVFQAIRKDTHDDKVDHMLDPRPEPRRRERAMRVALACPEGRKLKKLVHDQKTSLKRDVELRAQDSNIFSKIQSFIPANLIVIFQLLLPEFAKEYNRPLWMLVVLCLIAPIWACASRAFVAEDPNRKNTVARTTWSKYVLAGPAMFFWGLGTSEIAQHSFGWQDTTSASALAAIVIPALDSFFVGRGARKIWTFITIKKLDFFDWLKDKCYSLCGCREDEEYDILSERRSQVFEIDALRLNAATAPEHGPIRRASSNSNVRANDSSASESSASSRRALHTTGFLRSEHSQSYPRNLWEETRDGGWRLASV